MSLAPHNSHDDSGVYEGSGDRYPPDLRVARYKFNVDMSDGRDPESDVSGPVFSQTRWKSKR